MSHAGEQSDRAEPGAAIRPTKVRYFVVMIATVAAVILYLDRFCVSFAADYIKEDLQLTQSQIGWFFSAFFFSYALAQVPSGWLSDRYGARIMFAIYILAWSFFTALIGAVHSFAMLLITRLACGLGQAGAYPTSASMISKWVPFRRRGTASAWVSLGGRIGGAIAPLLTGFLIFQFSQNETSVELSSADLLNGPRLCAKLHPSEEKDATRPGDAGKYLWPRLSADAQTAVRTGAEQFRRPEQQRLQLITQQEDEFRDDRQEQIESLQKQMDNLRLNRSDEAALLKALNQLIGSSELYNEKAFGSTKLAREALKTYQRINAGESVSEAERRRFHRLLLEAAFPDEVSKIYVSGWRPVMYVYGAAGIFLAALVWIVYRNRPELHPWCNSAECTLIAAGRPPNAPSPHGKAGKIPLRRLLKSGSMWLSCLSQLGTNIGWIFLVTWLPRYLLSQHQEPILRRGLMATIPLTIGIAGVFCGGWLTDWLASRLGVRWGRRWPMSLTRFGAAGGYALCLWLSTFGAESPLNNVWIYVAALSLVAFSTDLGLPAAWAFNQDVGGRYVGSILGWGNMWGNLGASFSPLIYNFILGEQPGPGEWNMMFAVCMAAFIFSGVCCLGIDAAKPIAPPDRDEDGD